MFRFRDPKQPRRPCEGHARRCADAATRHALLAAAAAARASADALKWVADGRPGVPPVPPRPEPLPPVSLRPGPAPRPAGSKRPWMIGAVAIVLYVYPATSGLGPIRPLILLAVLAAVVFAAERLTRGLWRIVRRPAPVAAAPRIDPVPVVLVSPPPPIMAAQLLRPVRPAASPRGGKSSSKVLPILAVALLVGFVVAVSGVKTGRQTIVMPPPAQRDMGRLSPTKLTDYTADNAVVGGAKAALKALEEKAKLELTKVPQPVPPAAPILPIPPLPTPPKPVPPEQAVRLALHLAPDPATVKPRTAVKLAGVKGAPQTTKDAALADALLTAQGKLAEQFAKLDPPLDALPTVEQIRRDYLKPESVAEVKPTAEDREAWAKADLNPDRFWVTVDVEVSEDQVRQLRGERRLAANAPLFLLPLLVVGAIYGFLRVDAWTKGHLTGVLSLVAVGLAGGLGMVLLYAARIH